MTKNYTIKELLLVCTNLIKEKDFIRADALLTKILAKKNDLAEANYLMSIIALSLGKKVDFIIYIKKSLVVGIPQAKYLDLWQRYNELISNSDRSQLDNHSDHISSEFELQIDLNIKAINKFISLNSDLPKATSDFKDDALPLVLQKELLALRKSNSTALVKRAEKLLKSFKDSTFLKTILGSELKKQGKLKQAGEFFSQCVDQQPNNKAYLNNYGNILIELQKNVDAIQIFRRAIAIDPNYANAHVGLGLTLHNIFRYEEAKDSFNVAVSLDEYSAHAYFCRGNTNLSLHMNEEARFDYLKAIALKPQNPPAYNNLGTCLTHLGLFDAAAQSYRTAIDQKSDYAEPFYNLMNVKGVDFDAGELADVLVLCDDPKSSEADKMYLHFALGKHFEKHERYEESFLHYNAGNEIRKKSSDYDFKNDLKLFKSVKTDVWGRLKSFEPIHSDTKKPVFIIGMPRSGTSLVEQIIASHSEVYGAGELEFLAHSVKIADKAQQDGNFGPNNKNDIMGPFKVIRDRYMQRVNKIEFNEKFFTDKMPLNFRWVGHIINSFPNAKIICTDRDPVAVCWSIYKMNFASDGNGYATDLSVIGQYYKQYEALMRFWEKTFPGKILTVNYEQLTENPRETIQTMLNFVGVKWEEECLNFHDNKRPVNTASAAQIREKIYSGSSLKWKNYESKLTDLTNALDL